MIPDENIHKTTGKQTIKQNYDNQKKETSEDSKKINK